MRELNNSLHLGLGYLSADCSDTGTVSESKLEGNGEPRGTNYVQGPNIQAYFLPKSKLLSLIFIILQLF